MKEADVFALLFLWVTELSIPLPHVISDASGASKLPIGDSSSFVGRAFEEKKLK